MSKIISRVLKLLPITLAIVFIAFALWWNPKPAKIEIPEAHAQVQDYACIGNALTEYLNMLIQAAGPLTNIRLLSPAFNMTNPFGVNIANAMTAADPTWTSKVFGIAGNAYNCCSWAETPSGRVSDHVETFKRLTGISKAVLITETGVYEEDIDALRHELDIIQQNSNSSGTAKYLGALLFNAFKTGSSEWNRFGFDDDNQIKNDVCGGAGGGGVGSCQWIGVNSATFYPESSSFYSRASSLGMTYTLSMADANQSTTDGVLMALGNGLTPVIRVGYRQGAGPDAKSYGEYLKNLDGQINGTVYAIAGPNEPQSECWAAPECGCDLTPVVWDNPIDHPVEEGFYIDRFSCTQTADPEFHPLRPYPANACDMLIPRSEPEAPTQTLNKLDDDELADYLRYNTYACGSNMEFSHVESFDPYGIWDSYGYNDLGGIVEDSFGNQFLHTYCDNPGVLAFSTGTYSQTCYRTVGYNISTDFSTSNIGILGNTQNKDFSDEQKVNNYLSWYFTGATQIGDNILLDPDDEEDIDRMINFSGPIRKLLPLDAIEAIREVLINAVKNQTGDIHDYALNRQHTIRMSTVNDSLSEFFPHIPNSTLEDIAGEAFFTSYGTGDGAAGPPATLANPTPLTTAPYSLNITCAVGAHMNCPPGGPFRVGGSTIPGGTRGGSSGGTCSATPSGACLAPGESCCESSTFDLSCPVTETRCIPGGCSILPGQCMPPGESCCGNELYDSSCFLTESRCVAPGCSTLPGQCLAPGESCCGSETYDLSCPVTETRCA